MTTDLSLLSRYVEHLHARIRAQSNTPTARDEGERLAVLPASLNLLCTNDPRQCLELIVEALHQATSPHVVQAIGDGLLENLINEHSDRMAEEIANLLRDDERFRFAFACGKHAAVDPILLGEWVTILKSVGTTKQAERKKMWRAFRGS